MTTIRGSIAVSELNKGTSPEQELMSRLSFEHGAGNLQVTLSADKTLMNYVYTVAEKVGEGNHNAALIDGTLLDAVSLARVNLCNMSAVKMQGDKYVPVAEGDENATQKCVAINRLEEFLAAYARGTKR